MTNILRTVTTLAFGLLLIASIPAHSQAPGERFLSLAPPVGMPIVPLLEGWIRHEDGSRTFVFGYINRNEEEVNIPVGDNNYIEPAKYDGMQPTHFDSGRGSQVFTVTVPPNEAGDDVWWHLKTGESEATKVPGRANQSAYEIDFILPRPQGAMQPFLGAGDDGEARRGHSLFVENMGTARVGQPFELSVNVSDDSFRDPEDPRFEGPAEIGVHFEQHQGPGNVVFARDPSMPEPENPYDPRDPRFENWDPNQNAHVVEVETGNVATVMATFPAAGRYLIRVTAENWNRVDSAQGDQCCQSMGYLEVNVN